MAETELELDAKLVRTDGRFEVYRVRRAPKRPGIHYDAHPHWIIVPSVRRPHPVIREMVRVVGVADGMIALSERDALVRLGMLHGALNAREAMRTAGNHDAVAVLNKELARTVKDFNGRFDSRVLR